MSKKDGYRSRASHKLLELQEKDKLLRPGMMVVDLGAAIVGGKGKVLASDILTIADVEFIQGDFTDGAILGN